MQKKGTFTFPPLIGANSGIYPKKILVLKFAPMPFGPLMEIPFRALSVRSMAFDRFHEVFWTSLPFLISGPTSNHCKTSILFPHLPFALSSSLLSPDKNPNPSSLIASHTGGWRGWARGLRCGGAGFDSTALLRRGPSGRGGGDHTGWLASVVAAAKAGKGARRPRRRPQGRFQWGKYLC